MPTDHAKSRTRQPGIQVGLRHRHRSRLRPAGPERGDRPLHQPQEERAAVDARLAAEGVPPLADDGRAARLADAQVPADRLPGGELLLGAEAEERKSLDEVDPELLATYEKLGIPLHGAARSLGRAWRWMRSLTSVSVATTFKEKLAEHGHHLLLASARRCSEHPELVQKYLGSVVPYSDNYYATLNSAVFTDGSFVYIPKGVRCPMELSTYFRINAKNTGQFERTLIIADEGAYVSYLEGCTAPMRDENQLHAAVVELVALDNAHDQVQHRPELVSRRPQDRQGRHLQLRHQARRLPRREPARSPGRRSRPARRSPGNTRAASSRATTASASSTPSR